MRFHRVGMVVRSVSIADELCRERLKDDVPLVWGPVPAFSVCRRLLDEVSDD
jgi:hypothetical protein